MALDKNELALMLKKIPSVNPKNLLGVADQLTWVESQITERKKTLFRYQMDIELGKAYAESDEPNADNVAKQKLEEATGYIKALNIDLRVLNAKRDELKASQKIANVVE